MQTHSKEIVVKSNRLIEASYRLDLAEQRIILMAISVARETGSGITSDTFLEIHALDFVNTFNVDINTAYDQLKSAADTLFNRWIIIQESDPITGKPSDLKTRWVSAIRYVNSAGIIRIQFSSCVVPYITRLENNFTSYAILSISKMSSNYAIRLYELLVQWHKVGHREIQITELKCILGVQEEKSYERLERFKTKVINIAVSQINEFSDITVGYTQRKSGRTVTHLIFNITPKVVIATKKPHQVPLVALKTPPKSTAHTTQKNTVTTPKDTIIDPRFNEFLALPTDEQEQLRVLFKENLSPPLKDMWKKYIAEHAINPEFKPMFKAAFLDMLKQFEI
jgi:plasmid replication initiation protein